MCNEYCNCNNRCCCVGVPGPQGVPGVAGATGATGATGASAQAGLNAFGGLYNTSVQIPNITQADTYIPLEFNTAMPLYNVQTNSNSITVLENGFYEINYNILVNASDSIDLAITVRNNGAPILETRGTQTLDVVSTTSLTYDGRMTCSTIVALQAGNVLDLALSVLRTIPTGLDLIINNYANSAFSIKKLRDFDINA